MVGFSTNVGNVLLCLRTFGIRRCRIWLMLGFKQNANSSVLDESSVYVCVSLHPKLCPSQYCIFSFCAVWPTTSSVQLTALQCKFITTVCVWMQQQRALTKLVFLMNWEWEWAANSYPTKDSCWWFPHCMSWCKEVCHKTKCTSLIFTIFFLQCLQSC